MADIEDPDQYTISSSTTGPMQWNMLLSHHRTYKQFVNSSEYKLVLARISESGYFVQ